MRHRLVPPSTPSPDRASVKLLAVVATVAAVASLVSAAREDAAPPPPLAWTFAGLAEDPATYGLETPVASAGTWSIEPDAEAVGRRALVNRPGHEAHPPALALVRDLVARDARLHTRCRGACGVAFRARDASTHYAVHVDPSASEVVLTLVEDGHVRPLARRSIAPSSGWRELHVEVDGPHIRVDLDGARVLQVSDATLTGPGRKGLWVPATGSATFDVLTITTSAPPAS